MTYQLFARWFGLISVILACGILFNLKDAQDMLRNMTKSSDGYIMGGVLPVIFGSFALMHVNSLEPGWNLVITFVGTCMLIMGTYRIVFVEQWKALVHRHLEQIPFLFSLFGLMLGVGLLYIGFIAEYFEFVIG